MTAEKARIGHVHVIVDPSTSGRFDHVELATLAIRGGADTIQYRSKSSSMPLLVREAAEVADVCRRAQVTFIVNDHVDVALAVGSDGVHLGVDDMPIDVARRIVPERMLIGATVRSLVHCRRAHARGADYVGLGPIFPTSTKRVDHEPLGLALVRTISARAPIPVIGIAGITTDNVADVMDAGVWGIAVVGVVATAVDPEEVVRDLARRIADTRNEGRSLR